MIHSPIPGTGLPFHSPAGMAYRPQWMNIPNRASCHHPRRFCRSSSGEDAAVLTESAAATQTAMLVIRVHIIDIFDCRRLRHFAIAVSSLGELHHGVEFIRYIAVPWDPQTVGLQLAHVVIMW